MFSSFRVMESGSLRGDVIPTGCLKLFCQCHPWPRTGSWSLVLQGLTGDLALLQPLPASSLHLPGFTLETPKPTSLSLGIARRALCLGHITLGTARRGDGLCLLTTHLRALEVTS